MTEQTTHELDMMELRDKVRDMAYQLDKANEQLISHQSKLDKYTMRLNNIANICDDIQYEWNSHKHDTTYPMSELIRDESWFMRIVDEANE